ncbi:hypothetical protein GCM10028803_53180 [Larkinella knui]|nr:OmpW family outer membrane protein [Larkinella knui]
MKVIGSTFVLILLLLLDATAQTEKGRWLIGAQIGNFNYRQYKNDVGYTFSGSVMPSVNYFVRQNLLIGFDVPYSVEKSKLKNPLLTSYGSVEQQLGVGPSIRYYIGNSNFKPYVGISYTYSRYYHKYDMNANGDFRITSKGFRSNLAPGLGVAYFVNRNVVLNAGLTYNFYHDKWKNIIAGGSNLDNTSNNYKDKTLTLGIGFAVLFGE